MKGTINTPENNAKIEALKSLSQMRWVGNTTHDNIAKCLTAINLMSCVNSGWYEPKAIRIKGAQGIYMVNQDGSIHWENRIIKTDNNEYRIEYLTNQGYQDFEKKYFSMID